MSKRFTVKIETPEEYDGELGFFVITAVRTGRQWRSKGLDETYLLSEEQDALEPMINNGEKLRADDWEEYTGVL